jgi:hypothetical protein
MILAAEQAAPQLVRYDTATLRTTCSPCCCAASIAPAPRNCARWPIALA